MDLAERLDLSKSFISELEKKETEKNLAWTFWKDMPHILKYPSLSLLLFAEGTDSKKANEKARLYATDKILKMLEWIEETAKVDQSTVR